MAESADLHPTAGRRRREKGPPSGLELPRLERVSDTEGEHSDDSAGEKEAKRQRSEPTTPVSTSSRLPYEYDALMGITKVGTKEAEGFDEDLDSTEYLGKKRLRIMFHSKGQWGSKGVMVAHHWSALSC